MSHDDIPRSAIVALSVAAFGSGMSMRAIDPMLPRLATEFGVSLGQASLVVTVFSVSYGLSQLLFGPLGDRYGKFFVIAWSCIAAALASLLCGFMSDFHALLAARMLAGLTIAALIPLAMAWIGDVVPYERRQAVLARFLIGQIFGISSGAFVGGLCADYFSWRAPFFLISLCFGLIGAYLIDLERKLPPIARQLHKGEGNALRRLWSEFAIVSAIPWARVVFSTVAIEGSLVFGSQAFLASHLHLRHGLSLASAGSLVMLFGAGGFAYAISSRRLIGRLGEPGLVRNGSRLMALALLAIGFSPSWGWAIPGCFFFGLGFYMMHNTLQINATQMAPARRGASVAAFACTFFLGQSFGVAVNGMLLGMVGTSYMLVASGFGILVLGSSFARLRDRYSASVKI